MVLMPKAFLLPIDDTEESLRPIRFLTQLYADRSEISLTVHYLVPSLPPVYAEGRLSPAQVAKKKEFLRKREEAAQRACARAKQVLLESGFSEDIIHEFVQEKELTVAHHACRLADIKRVDAVLFPKQASSRLEGFLKGDHTSALLHHCLVSPIWFVDNPVDISRAVVCVSEHAASVRALDHALFMLEGTSTRIDVVHFSKRLSKKIVAEGRESSAEMDRWVADQPKEVRENYAKALDMIGQSSIEAERLRLVAAPHSGKVAADILAYCAEQRAGIVVLGHGGSEGTWGFLKSSVTKKILADFRHQAVWVNQ
ncbi:universal stress protein [Desulfosoma caldarium]|uniref:Universal stress protein family protein n=1 Tax=Desulfosoma caldarium TaxID=610254 RepID=A0A3N1UFV2_9BACT|nr:universal stress protein [Desulfosoma caldarium]ROQ90205.1 universal stress protein family protein [Desulfosoma caldarium]